MSAVFGFFLLLGITLVLGFSTLAMGKKTANALFNGDIISSLFCGFLTLIGFKMSIFSALILIAACLGSART